ncbi:hypothetical protein [Burkholderia cenocepacia]|uniref:hypothetical protein n=1 Tax=Burkholderia cenocepacia TaxID=95486 RepID=UPI0013E07FC4|nr:hypothetical protein [Burkholderia cenocepacia]
MNQSLVDDGNRHAGTGAIVSHRRCAPAVRDAAALRQVSHSRTNLADRQGAARDPAADFSSTLRHAQATANPSRPRSVRCMPDPDANIICRNIDMHALTDIACVAGSIAGTSRAGPSIAPSRWRTPVLRRAPRGGLSPFPAFTT